MRGRDKGFKSGDEVESKNPAAPSSSGCGEEKHLTERDEGDMGADGNGSGQVFVPASKKSKVEGSDMN